MDEYGRLGKLRWCDNRNKTHQNRLLNYMILTMFCFGRYPQKYPNKIFCSTTRSQKSFSVVFTSSRGTY